MKRKMIIIALSLLVFLLLGGIAAAKAVKHLKIRNSINLGNKYSQEGNYQKAVSAFEKAMEIEPKNIDARVGLGWAYTGLEEFNKAEEALKGALELEPQNPDVYVELNRLYLIVNRAYEAMSILNNGFEITRDVKIKHMLEDFKTRVAVSDIFETIVAGGAFTFPQRVKVKINNADVELAVEWNNNSVDTGKPGSFTYVGKLEIIDKEVKLNLRVVSSLEYISGNTSGNLANLGLIAQKDGWIYRIEITAPRLTGGNLYKMHPDGSKKTRLTDEATGFLNIVDDWIYYQNGADMFKIYKIRTDGTECTKLNEDESWNINVSDGWIYYNNFSDNLSIYKMRTDGTEKTRLSYINADIYVKDGWIYGGLWKIRTDGTEETYLGEDSASCTNIVADWIYYINSMDNKMYKLRTDGSERTKLCDDVITCINVWDGWIYYSKGFDKGRLYKIRTDGTNRVKLSSDDGIYINVVESGVYYMSRSDDGLMYRVNTDGSNRQRVE